MFHVKAASFYEYSSDLPPVNGIRQAIDDNLIEEIGSKSAMNVGFTQQPGAPLPLEEDFQLSMLVKDHCLCFCVRIEERKVPPSAIKYKYEQWLEKNPAPERKEEREAKLRIYEELLPLYPPQPVDVECMINTRAGELTIASCKNKECEEVLGYLRAVFGVGALRKEDYYSHRFPLVLTEAFSAQDFEPFKFGGDITLKGTEKERVTGSKVDQAELKQLIDDGYKVDSLSLISKTNFGSVGFKVDSKGGVKSFSLLDHDENSAMANAVDDGYAEQVYANIVSVSAIMKDMQALAKKYGEATETDLENAGEEAIVTGEPDMTNVALSTTDDETADMLDAIEQNSGSGHVPDFDVAPPGSDQEDTPWN